MMDDLQQAIEKLRFLSPQLNAAVEEAQRTVDMVEHFLSDECRLAIQAEVPARYNDKGTAIELLRYGRTDNRFRILITNTDGETRFVTRPWADCERGEK